MEYRVEELSRAALVSVDTIRFYQAKRLLPPPRRIGRVAIYDDDHLERLRQIRRLQGRGFTLGVIGRIIREELGRADEALVEAVVGGADERRPDGSPEEFLTLSELAERAGVPMALLEALEKEGVLIPRRHEGESRYTEADSAALRAGLRLLEYGLPLGDVLELARLHGQSARALAERAVELFDEHVRHAPRRDGEEDPEAAARLVQAFDALLPATVSLVAHHFRRTLLAVAQEHIEAVGDQDEVAAVRSEALRRLELPLTVEG
jgi:DNA-binding transcriptional MerR regulator